MLTNVPLSHRSASAGWVASWLDCENLQERPRAKDAVVTPFFFLPLPVDNSNWAETRLEGVYSHIKRLKLVSAAI